MAVFVLLEARRAVRHRTAAALVEAADDWRSTIKHGVQLAQIAAACCCRRGGRIVDAAHA